MISLAIAAALTAAPAAKSLENWGMLAFVTGRCYSILSISEQLEAKSLIDEAPPFRRGYMTALLEKGKAVKDYVPGGRQMCKEVIEETLTAISHGH